jgi:Lar family restriction alleviation protein
MDKLLPCPFCGENGTIKTRYIGYGSIGLGGHDEYRVVCKGCRTSSDEYRTKEQAISAWNRRVDARQLALKTRVCPMCEDCPDGCPVETPKDSRNIVTNAERIRSMTDEELAKEIQLIRAGALNEYFEAIGVGIIVNGHAADYQQTLHWLCQPAKEDA